MKSRCTVGLLLFASLGGFAAGANAQSAGSPSLLPLPPVVRMAGDFRAVNYNSYYAEPTPATAPPEQFDSAFHNRTSATDPADTATAPPATAPPAMPRRKPNTNGRCTTPAGTMPTPSAANPATAAAAGSAPSAASS